MFKNINWVAVLVAVVLLEALGFLWYGFAFRDAWTTAYTASLGRAPDPGNMALSQSLGVINTLILVVGLGWVLDRLGVKSMAAVTSALAVWFFFNFTTMAIEYIYMAMGLNLVAINMGYQLVSYLVAGAVLGLMPRRGKDPA